MVIIRCIIICGGLWFTHYQNSCISKSTLVISALNLETCLHFIIIFFLFLEYDHLCHWWFIHGFAILCLHGVSNSNFVPFEDAQSFWKWSIAHKSNINCSTSFISSVCDLLFTLTSAEEYFLIFSTFLFYCHTVVTLLRPYFVLVEFSYW